MPGYFPHHRVVAFWVGISVPHRVCTLVQLRSACRISQQPAGCLERGGEGKAQSSQPSNQLSRVGFLVLLRVCPALVHISQVLVELVAATAAWLCGHTAENTGHLTIVCQCVFVAAQPIQLLRAAWQGYQSVSCCLPSATARCVRQPWPCVSSACSSLQACREFSQTFHFPQTGVCGSSGRKAEVAGWVILWVVGRANVWW